MIIFCYIGTCTQSITTTNPGHIHTILGILCIIGKFPEISYHKILDFSDLFNPNFPKGNKIDDKFFIEAYYWLFQDLLYKS